MLKFPHKEAMSFALPVCLFSKESVFSHSVMSVKDRGI